MMLLTHDKSVFGFSKDNAPVLTVASGTTVAIETLDCFSNQLREPEDTLDVLDWDRTNPATGPIYVEDAKVGDVLKVTIKDIVVDEKGTAVSGATFGTLGHLLEGSHTEIIHIEDGMAKFMNKIDIPINPMIGVIGVAPAEGVINNGTPGKHGGNMDNKMITKGSTLYFDVEVDGALFGLGDVHAVMGDGEIGVTGLEIPSTVTVELEVLKGKTVDYPMLENDEAWSVIVSKPTADEAAKVATELMFNFLKTRMDMPEPQIVMLMSLTGDVQFCQIVDPLVTVRYTMPKVYTGKIEL